MPKILISICLLLSLCINSFAQQKKKTIVDHKSQALTDSIKAGMQALAHQLGKPVNKLHFYVQMESAMADIERYIITLDAYPKDKKFKYQQLINSTNEFLKVDNDLLLPSIFDMDLFNELLSRGYHISLSITDGQETITTSIGAL